MQETLNKSEERSVGIAQKASGFCILPHRPPPQEWETMSPRARTNSVLA